MNIAMFHELHAGGARRAVNAYAKLLKKNNGVDLYIIDTSFPDSEKANYQKIYFFKFIPILWNGGNWKNKLLKDTVELVKLYYLHKKIANQIDEKNYDLVFIHPSRYTQAPFILRFLKTKKVYYCQEPLRIVYDKALTIPSDISLPKKIYESINRFSRKIIDSQNINYADIILANSTQSQKKIASAYHLKSEVSYLGVDTDLFKPSSKHKKYDLLFIGAKDSLDGYDLLMKAVKSMKMKPSIKTHISGVNWIKDDKDFAELYASAKVVLCLAHHEPFGLIPIEAMACGVPVIAVNEGGYTESVKDNETGFLISRKKEVLADKIQLLLQNDNLRKQMGENARRYVVANWTWARSVQKFKSIVSANEK